MGHSKIDSTGCLNKVLFIDNCLSKKDTKKTHIVSKEFQSFCCDPSTKKERKKKSKKFQHD